MIGRTGPNPSAPVAPGPVEGACGRTGGRRSPRQLPVAALAGPMRLAGPARMMVLMPAVSSGRVSRVRPAGGRVGPGDVPLGGDSDCSDALSAMVGSAVLGLDPEPEAAVRARVVSVLRTALVPAHVEAQRFDAAMRLTEQTADRFGRWRRSVLVTVRVTSPRSRSCVRLTRRDGGGAHLVCGLDAGPQPYELPLSPLDLENAGPMRSRRSWRLPLPSARSKVVAAAALGWGVLNLVIGGIVTVLPLPILPFAPEQSVTHYAAHVVYTLGQVPLVLLFLPCARRTGRG